LEARFEAATPEILGALLGGVAQALRDEARLSEAIMQKPRMADFAVWAAAPAPAFGWMATDFLRAYGVNREEAVARVLEADPVAEAVIDFAGQAAGWAPLNLGNGNVDWTLRVWKDTAGTLLGALGQLVPEDTRRERSWPKDSTRLAGCLRRAAPALRTKGIRLEFFRERKELPDGTKGETRRVVCITVKERGERKRGNG
jgi:hypothetical protein